MKKTMSIIGNIVLYVTSYFAAMLIFGLIMRIPARSSDIIKGWILNNQGVLMLGTSLIAFILLYAIFKLKKKSFISYCGFTSISIKNILMLTIIGASLGIFSSSFVKLPYIIQAIPTLGDMLKTITDGDLIIIAILGPVVFGSFIEEVLFRGAVFNELKRGMSKYKSLVVHGLLFTIIYGFIAANIFVGIYAAVGAVIFGLLYIWLHSIWAAIITHIASSMTLLLFSKLDNLDLSANSIVYLVTGSLLVLIAELGVLYKTNKNEAKDDNKSLGL